MLKQADGTRLLLPIEMQQKSVGLDPSCAFGTFVPVLIPVNSCRDQGPLKHLCEPEPACAAVGITVQKTGERHPCNN